MTSKQLVERLENLANRRTFYKNKYPYNLCYVHEDGRTSADCVNLYKALLNGYNVNNTTVGYFQNNLSNTGDCTEWGLMKQCSDVSTDFKKLKEGEPRLLYKDGHIGGYIGKEVTRNGKVYNCIECTAAWGGGILYSYVTNTGGRYNCKGGSKNGAWTHNGLMTPWVDYSSAPQPQPTPQPQKSIDEVAKEVIQGKWGVGAERKARLEAAGYDYREVQNRVNEMMKDTQNQPPQSHVEPEKVEGYVIGDTYTTQPYSGLNVRKSPSLTASLAGNCLPRGTKIKCLEIKKVDGNVWMRIVDKGWCCAKRGTNVYIK
jgi:hypothetical protein